MATFFALNRQYAMWAPPWDETESPPERRWPWHCWHHYSHNYRFYTFDISTEKLPVASGIVLITGLFIVSVAAALSLIIGVLRRKDLRNDVGKLLMVNVAFLILFRAPIAFVYYLKPYWSIMDALAPKSSLACEILYIIHNGLWMSTAYAILLVLIDRCIFVCKPEWYAQRMSISSWCVVTMILPAVAMGIQCGIIFGAGSGMLDVSVCGCYIEFKASQHIQIYTVTQALVSFAIPMVMMLATTIALLIKHCALLRQSDQSPEFGTEMRNGAKVSCVVTAAFLLMWGPYVASFCWFVLWLQLTIYLGELNCVVIMLALWLSIQRPSSIYHTDIDFDDAFGLTDQVNKPDISRQMITMGYLAT